MLSVGTKSVTKLNKSIRVNCKQHFDVGKEFLEMTNFPPSNKQFLFFEMTCRRLIQIPTRVRSGQYFSKPRTTRVQVIFLSIGFDCFNVTKK